MKEHQKKYYGSLLFIVVLILATAVVLQRFGSDGFGKGDVTGMASYSFSFKEKHFQIYDAPTTIDGKTGQVFVGTLDTNQKLEVNAAYNVVKDKNGNTYLAAKDGDDIVLIDINDGKKYVQQENNLVLVDETSQYLTEDVLTELKNKESMSKIIKVTSNSETLVTQEQEKQSRYQAAAQKLGLGEGGDKVLAGEERAIESYLDKSEVYKDAEYDPTTGQYSGKIGEYTVSYNDDGQMGVALKDNTVVYKDTSTIPAIYRTAGGEKVDADHLAEAKDAIRGAEKEVNKLETNVQKELQNCGKKNSDDCLITYTDETGKLVTVSATARQEAYMNKIYEQQEAQVKGLITGWLNNWLDDILGGWSRGVPAGICAHIFGLEYYKQDGWTRVPMNASADQLQSELIANSRTVLIEGEKEEITDSLFRYAYTIKLLANESVEWQTYMYNSCTAETSVEQFYDYGYLAPGAYFSFHYAGAGDVDMIFDCTTEDCLYDQACVAFTDGSAPTCVSLVHGAGFETPDAGSDYDCI